MRSERAEILGVRVDTLSLDGVLERIRRWLDEPGGGLRHIVTVNPEFIIAARRHPRFDDVLRAADISTADGVGITYAARLLNLPIQRRITGNDLVEGIAGLDHPNCRVFLLGAGEGIAAEAAAALRQDHPDVQIAGTFSGDASPQGWPEIQRQLEIARPTILLVAFGHPKQDLWISINRERLAEHGILVAAGVGGAFDYRSGYVARAPGFIRRAGFEWLYRLIRQPWRWRRQLALPHFALLVIWERLWMARH